MSMGYVTVEAYRELEKEIAALKEQKEVQDATARRRDDLEAEIVKLKLEIAYNLEPGRGWMEVPEGWEE
jgi:cell division protein FtsB